jgi:hypothetical protein
MGDSGGRRSSPRQVPPQHTRYPKPRKGVAIPPLPKFRFYGPNTGKPASDSSS